MLGEDRAKALEVVVQDAAATVLRSGPKRRAFARELAERLGMEPRRVQSFVDEMAGLNFFNLEDRKTFIDFARHGL